jgi:chorismate mutase
MNTDTEIIARNSRVYRKITPEVMARFLAARMEYGSGTAAVKALEPDETDPRRRAWLISTKCKQSEVGDLFDRRVEQIAEDAVNRLAGLIYSDDEQVATKSIMYVIDQVRGKAINRTETKHHRLNIQSVLD